MVQSEFTEVYLISINPQPLFNLSFGHHQDKLVDSINQFGLLTPLILRKNSQQGNDFHIIDGSQRFLALNQCGIKKVSCVIYSSEALNDHQAFQLALEVNQWVRSFNLMEQALILKQALEFNDHEIKKLTYSLFNLQHDKQAKEIVGLLNLPDEIKFYIIKNNLSFKVASLLNQFEKEDCFDLFNQLKELPLNQNNLKIVLELVFEISRRDEENPAEIFKLANDLQEQNLFTKIELIKQNLFLKRYPVYQSQVNHFNQSLKELKLEEGIQVAKSPSSDNDFMEVKFRLSSDQQRQKIVEELKKEGWKKLF